MALEAFRLRLRIAKIAFRGGFSFPVEGRYQVILSADGESIAQRTLEVSVKKEKA
jgi:hypothetical protein